MDSNTPQLPPNFNLQPPPPPLPWTSKTKVRSVDGTTQLPPNFNLQEMLSLKHPPLGLQFTITRDLVATLTRGRPAVAEVDQSPSTKQKQMSASHLPLISLSIGPTWQRAGCRREDELTAKLYFAKKKLIWEILEGPLKTKIEVSWSDITAIHAHMPPSPHPGLLRVQLGNPPLFFLETQPQATKHTIWEPISDFTDGHALLHRIHCATMPHGKLEEHYSKLLHNDERLFKLSKNHFPSEEESFYFNTSSTSQQLHSFTRVEQSLPPLNNIPTSHHLVNPMTSMFSHVGESSRNQDKHQRDHHIISSMGSNEIFLSEFNQFQNHINNVPANSYPYGVSYADQPRMENVSAQHHNNNAASWPTSVPTAWLNLDSPGGSNIYGPELGYGGVTGEKKWSESPNSTSVIAEQELDGDANIDNNMDLHSIYHHFNRNRAT